MLDDIQIQFLANLIDLAALNARPVSQLSLKHQFTENEAYAIQAESIRRRIARGENLIGVKLGFTSKAKMEQMGVHDMIWGQLTDGMLIDDRGTINLDNFIHPRAEPEICFHVSRAIDRAIDRSEVYAFVDSIACAIEVIDSRYEHFKFTLEDVIADNCSSAAFIVGPWLNNTTQIEDLSMSLVIDGTTVHTGSSAAILGDPWSSVIAAARLATKYGLVIPEGAFIMAGAATPAAFLERGQSVAVMVEQLGTCGFKVQ